MNENEWKELTESFLAYRDLLVPLQESLGALSETYGEIRKDLDNLTRSFSGGGQLDKIHSTLAAQAQSGKQLEAKISDYSVSADRYAQAVGEMTKKVSEVAKRLETVSEIERTAEGLLSRLDALINEKRASYNLKELQHSLDSYNKNVEKVGEFINKDIAAVLADNAAKIEAIRKENEALLATVGEQGKSIAALSATFLETSSLLKKTVESGSVNEEYLFDAFDRWAAERKVKIKNK